LTLHVGAHGNLCTFRAHHPASPAEISLATTDRGAIQLTFLLVQASHTELLVFIDAHYTALRALWLAFEAVLCILEVETLIACDTSLIVSVIPLLVAAHHAVSDNRIDIASTRFAAHMGLLAILELFHISFLFDEGIYLAVRSVIFLLACNAIGLFYVSPTFNRVDQSTVPASPLILLEGFLFLRGSRMLACALGLLLHCLLFWFRCFLRSSCSAFTASIRLN